MKNCMMKNLLATSLMIVSTVGLPRWCSVALSAESSVMPTVLDDRLELTLIADSSRVRTPIGLAIDQEDRLYVLESHTHLRPHGYVGPESDRVLRFSDGDGDGSFESVDVFAEGIQMGMNMAFSPHGVLHVVSAKQVWSLSDQDRDGRCDRMEVVLEMKAGSNYAHNCLLGITFDDAGWMYVARGNVGSTPYEIRGTDGTAARGYGDGGSIVRCRLDGSQVEQYAIGFWNPIQMKFDHAGRLLCVDNDPDARGPNRLVHVVRGGDYGHRNMDGNDGTHPFQGWNGDLPGTLPYAGATGEAPCDVLDSRRTSLPKDYTDSVLVTVWNENTIEWHRTTQAGRSFRSVAEVLIRGDKEFRPVAIDADSRGDVFFTDWVRRDYPNHGEGRIWRLSHHDKADAIRPLGPHERTVSPAPQPLDTPQADGVPDPNGDRVKDQLTSDDPFDRHFAIESLAAGADRGRIESLSRSPEPLHRLAATLIVARRHPGGASKNVKRWEIELLRRGLSDPDAEVRRSALIVAGTGRWTILRESVHDAIEAKEVSALLFATYLACVECLDPRFVQAYEARTYASAKDIPRRSDQSLLIDLVLDADRPAAVRILAAQRLDRPWPANIRRGIASWLQSDVSDLRITAIRFHGDPLDLTDELLRIAADAGCTDAVRCEAILALEGSGDIAASVIAALINDKSADVAIQAARSLKSLTASNAMASFAEASPTHTGIQPIQESLDMMRGRDSGDRPQSLRQWQQALAAGGNAIAGQRVFRSTAASCRNCHADDGQHHTLGPNLDRIAQSIDRSQIVRSILRPSDEFAPQYQAWTILTTDGEVFRGLQMDHKSGGAIELISTEGRKRRFEADEIETYQPSSTSIMPDGLERRLTVSELRDLVAYLSRPEPAADVKDKTPPFPVDK